jgi:OOP family OmpA-OmpF porin
MNKNLPISGVLSALAVGVLLGSTAFAHEAGETNKSYVGDSDGHYITDSAGNCVRTGAWDKGDMTVDCGAEPAVAEAPPPPAPVPETVYETTTLQGGALFDLNKSTLKESGKASLKELADKINDNDRVTEVKIVGHTDNTGTDEYNQGLSERRAATVRDYAIEKGVKPEIITSSGMGESAPVADNSTSEGRAQNRRVEVTVGVTKAQ